MISPEDFSALEQRITEPEYLIEFALADSARPGAVIDDYKEAGLPGNGINVSASMIQFMNSLNAILIGKYLKQIRWYNALCLQKLL